MRTYIECPHCEYLNDASNSICNSCGEDMSGNGGGG